jgi:hypothetical protein
MLFEERDQLRTTQIEAQYGTIVLVNAVQGEHGLGRVEANAAKLLVWTAPGGIDVPE